MGGIICGLVQPPPSPQWHQVRDTPSASLRSDRRDLPSPCCRLRGSASPEPTPLVTIHTLLASARSGLDQSTTSGRRIQTCYVDHLCLISSRGAIFPGSHRSWLILLVIIYCSDFHKYNHHYVLFSVPLIDHAKKLFPICRSLTGEGARATLKCFENFHPEYQRLVFRSGTKVFDWQIPKEWNIKDAFIQHIDSNTQFARFSDSNLHVMGYSVPVDSVLDLAEFESRLYTQKDQPAWIPYVTSYYNKNWGFCLSQVEKESLPSGKYRVLKDSSLFDGELHISHAVLTGRTTDEIFFSSYICHPSMANNELSGPVILNAILD